MDKIKEIDNIKNDLKNIDNEIIKESNEIKKLKLKYKPLRFRNSIISLILFVISCTINQNLLINANEINSSLNYLIYIKPIITFTMLFTLIITITNSINLVNSLILMNYNNEIKVQLNKKQKNMISLINTKKRKSIAIDKLNKTYKNQIEKFYNLTNKKIKLIDN